jgi:hypothetical protein
MNWKLLTPSDPCAHETWFASSHHPDEYLCRDCGAAVWGPGENPPGLIVVEHP